VTVNCAHPGGVRTNLGASNGWVYKLLRPIAGLFLRSPEDGARTSIYLCTSPDVANTTGTYFANEKPKRPNALARDDDAAERLWRISAEMVGLEP
jgi:hypothetical protein